MEETQTFDTIAELAIALAGFSGIVAVLGNRFSGEWGAAEQVRLRLLLEVSLLVVFLSFLPSLVARVAPSSVAWRVSNGACGIAHLVPLVLFFLRWRRLGWQSPAHEPLRPLLYKVASAAFAMGGLAIILFQLLVAVGLPVVLPSLIYEVSLLWLLLAGAIQFVNLLLYRGAEV